MVLSFPKAHPFFFPMSGLGQFLDPLFLLKGSGFCGLRRFALFKVIQKLGFARKNEWPWGTFLTAWFWFSNAHDRNLHFIKILFFGSGILPPVVPQVGFRWLIRLLSRRSWEEKVMGLLVGSASTKAIGGSNNAVPFVYKLHDFSLNHILKRK